MATTHFLKAPPINYSSKGAIAAEAMCICLSQSVYLLAAPSTPVDGVAGTGTGAGFAGIGSIYIDVTAGKMYVNGGTKASPAWKIVTSA